MKENIKLALQAALIFCAPLLLKHHISVGNDDLDELAGGLAVAWGVIWKYWHYWAPPAPPTNPTPPSATRLPIHLMLTVLLLAPLARAQSTNYAPFISFEQEVQTNGELTLTCYPEYAPDITVNGKKDVFGAGFAVLTSPTAISALSTVPLAQHAFVGLRFDYLAHQAFGSTVALGLKGDMQIFGHTFEGYAESGANFPISGFGVQNGNIGAMAGAGAYTTIFSFGSTLANGSRAGVFGVQLTGEKWTQFSGWVFLGGPVLNWSF